MSVPRFVAGPARSSVWRYIPIALLFGIACTQIWLAHTAGLSPWVGGGFGMFTTTDGDGSGNRHLHVFAVRAGRRRELFIPPPLRDQANRALMFPSKAALRTLARALAIALRPEEGPLEAIVTQVWTTRFDTETLAPSGVLLRSLEVPGGQ
jgi:hypothetical protein